jgi:methyl-accepting chemotaxis protein
MVVVVVGLSTVLVLMAAASETETAQDNMLNLTGIASKEVQLDFEIYLDAINTLSMIMNSYESIDTNGRRARYDANMLGVIESLPAVVGIYTVWKPYIIDSDDEPYDTWFTRRYSELPERHRFRDVEDLTALTAEISEFPTVSSPRKELLNGKDVYITRIQTPIIRERDNEVIGIIGVMYNLEKPQKEIIEKLTPYGTGQAILYSTDGTIAAHYDASRVGGSVTDAESVKLQGQEAIDSAIISLESGTPDVSEGNERFFASYPFYVGKSEAPWTIITSVEKKVVLESVYQMIRFAVTAALIAILVSAVIIFFVALNIAKRIEAVGDAMKDIAQGEGDLTKRLEIRSHDEIGVMGTYFNQTMEKIQRLVVAIKSKSGELANIGNELSTNMTETAAAINQITSNIQSIKDLVVNQSTSVSKTNGSMQNITGNIEKLGELVDRQTTSVSESSSAVEEMLANIQSVTQTLIKNVENVRALADASEVGRSGLQDVSADIQQIARESEGLLEINSVMENIASQTNLLSMNAAIEAAHAGEAGKGFAVVADEIRKLAESSSEQSKTISTVLKKIKDSIDKITRSTDAVLNKFEAIDSGVKTVSDQEENVRNAMEEQSAGSQQILESISQLNELTGMVKTSSEEMRQGSVEVIRESRSLGQVTEEVSGGMNEMATGADQINIAVTRVNEISGINKENIDILVTEVGKFKVD